MSELYDDELFDMKKEFTCPYCSGKFELDLSQEYNDTKEEDREMGPEIIYSFDFKWNCPVCNKMIGIKGYISEYPQGAYNDSSFEIEKLDLVSEDDIEPSMEECFEKDSITYHEHFRELITDYVDDVKVLLNKKANAICIDDKYFYDEDLFNSIIDEFVGEKQVEYID